jgi:hypothetical protein
MRFPKEQRTRSPAYLRAVASLPCILCGIESASQAAHVNAGKAKGLKACDLQTFPLCHVGANGCHAAFDAYEIAGRDRQAEIEPSLVAQTQALLIERSWTDHRLRALLVKLVVVA